MQIFVRISMDVVSEMLFHVSGYVEAAELPVVASLDLACCSQ